MQDTSSPEVEFWTQGQISEIYSVSFFHLTFCDIKVEEVTIQDGLDHPSHNSDHVEEALKVEPPDPVEEIEGTVDPQAEQIVGGDGLSLSSLTDQEELRQNGHWLKVDGEGPQDLIL